jgi:hypothetical protein
MLRPYHEDALRTLAAAALAEGKKHLRGKVAGAGAGAVAGAGAGSEGDGWMTDADAALVVEARARGALFAAAVAAGAVTPVAVEGITKVGRCRLIPD